MSTECVMVYVLYCSVWAVPSIIVDNNIIFYAMNYTTTIP
jgi:hypothetical protein